METISPTPLLKHVQNQKPLPLLLEKELQRAPVSVNATAMPRCQTEVHGVISPSSLSAHVTSQHLIQDGSWSHLPFFKLSLPPT